MNSADWEKTLGDFLDVVKAHPLPFVVFGCVVFGFVLGAILL